MPKILLFCQHAAIAGVAHVRRLAGQVPAWFTRRRRSSTSPAPLLELEAEPVEELAPESTPEPKTIELERWAAARRVRLSPAADTTDAGTRWHFRDQILDRLDEYFACIRKMRSHDPDMYALFARLGFTVPADHFWNAEHGATDDELRTAPRVAFGGILCGGMGDNKARAGELGKGRVAPVFVYFAKMANPIGVEHAAGAVYHVTALYGDRSRSDHYRSAWIMRAPSSFYITLAPDGSTRLLRERSRSTVDIQTRRGARRETIKLSYTQWTPPAWLADVGRPNEAPRSMEANARWLFALAFLTHLKAIDRVIVRAARGGIVAAFGIELERAKYFFRDRAIDLAVDGRRRRIFHSVIEHDRTLANGRATHVRTHYRGVRRFDWNSHAITIVTPERNEIVKFPTAALEQDAIAPADQDHYLNAGGVGAKIAEALCQ